MAQSTQLAKALRESVKHYKLISDLAEELESLGQLEQTADELNRAVAARRQELQKLQTEKQAIEESIVEARKNTISEAQTKASEMINQAQSEWQQLIDEAREKAANIKKAAQAHADSIISHANQLKKQAESLLDDKEADMAALQMQYDSTKKELTEMQAKRDKIKTELAKFMEG